jgi:tRNA(Ile)-lysidine synthase
MALAAAAVFESRAAGWLPGAAVVDHQLQPDSARVAVHVRDRLRALGCDPVEILTVDVGSARGPEAAARDARYAALTSYADDLDAVVLLGHTRDDQAETVLLGLGRGSGLRSLAGMPPRRDRLRRPFLVLPRQLTQHACEAMGLPVWQDPHNSDLRFSRVRVRYEVLPVLERALGPGVSEALARTAGLARADADALDALAADPLTRLRATSAGLSVDGLLSAPPAIRRRVLRRWAIDGGAPAGELTASHVEAIDRLLTDWHGQRRVDLPGGVRASRRAGELHLRLPEG